MPRQRRRASVLLRCDAIVWSSTEQPWKPKYNPWPIAVVVAMAAFMEILDTSIANVALPHIAGNLGVSNEESTWVLTSYLVSNAIVLPISGWLAGAFGRKRFFLTCIVLFTPQLASLRLRAESGAADLVPHDSGRGRRRTAADGAGDPGRHVSAGAARHGVRALRRHAIIGADDWADARRLDHRQLQLALDLPHQPSGRRRWRCSSSAADRGSAVSEAPRARAARFDYVGVALLVLGVGALQMMLDKGQEEDWFGSHVHRDAGGRRGGLPDRARHLGVVPQGSDHRRAAVHGTSTSSARNVMMFILGVLLFSSLVMMPQFLQSALGYTATRGLVLSVGGVVMLITMPTSAGSRRKCRRGISSRSAGCCLAARMYLHDD